MQFIIFLLFFCLFIFLFCLYILSRDDFVFLRENVTVEKVFDFSFLTAAVGLFFARFVYVSFNFDPKFLNPLNFFLFPYFPGLSLAGGVGGAAIFTVIFSKRYKIPRGRIFDFFALSFLCALSVGLLIQQVSSVLTKKTFVFTETLEIIIYFILFAAFFRVLPKVKFKDGSLGLLVLISFSVISFFFPFSFQKEDLIPLVIFLISVVFLIRQEKPLPFKKLNNSNRG